MIQRRWSIDDQRRWTPPPPASSLPPDADADPPAPSPRSHWGAAEHLSSFIIYMMFFGVLAGVFHSRFPVDLGLFFFFTNDDLREYLLRKIGIRLVPGTLGPPFVQAFVWLTGVSILMARWYDATPAWLATWLPPPDAPWPFIALVAFGVAVVTVLATRTVRGLLPQFGIAVRPGTLGGAIAEGLVGFAILGLLFLTLYFLSSLPIVSDVLGNHWSTWHHT